MNSFLLVFSAVCALLSILYLIFLSFQMKKYFVAVKNRTKNANHFGKSLCRRLLSAYLALVVSFSIFENSSFFTHSTIQLFFNNLPVAIFGALYNTGIAAFTIALFCFLVYKISKSGYHG